MADGSVNVDVLGPLRVRVGDGPVAISTPRLRTVLVRLALDVGRAVSVDRLVDDLWPKGPPDGALGSLRSYLSQLRSQLTTEDLPGGTLIVTHGRGYALEIPPEALDTIRFEQLLTDAEAIAANGDHTAALDLYSQGLRLWRGDALADVRDLPFAQPEVTRLEELRLGTLEDRCEVLLQAGRHREAVPELEALVATSPHRERPRTQLMLALYRSGRSADALRVHRDYRTALADELGLDPGPSIEGLAEDILRQDPRLLVPPRAQEATPELAHSRGETSSVAHTNVVGRTHEREVLRAAIRQADSGQGRCVLLAGEPGIGKTSLLEEAAALASTAELPVHWGRCLETDGAPALWMWREVVQSILDGRDKSEMETLASGPTGRALQLLGAPTRDTETDWRDDIEQARFDLYQAVIALVGQTGPCVVVLEDIHWADTYSLQLLGELASHVPRQPTVIAASYRDVDPHGSPELAATLATISRLPGAQIMELVGLDLEDVTELLSKATGTTPTSEAVERVMWRTAGNPFFVRQLASLSVDDGDGVNENGKSVPVGVRHVIEQRVTLLGDDVRSTLEAAAMLGRDFRLPAVAAVSSQHLDVVLDHADRAVGHGLVEAGTEATLAYRFVHSLVRETLYELIAPARRLRLHAAAGAALEDSGAAPAEQVAEHYWAAVGLVDRDTVIGALRRAATAARTVLAYDQAEMYLRRCLELLDQEPGSDPRTELATRLELVKIMTSRRGWTAIEVEDVAGRVREIVDEAGIGPDLIPLWWALWNHYFTRGDLGTADELASKLLADAESHDSPPCRVAGRVAAAMMCLHRTADVDGALTHLAAARESEPASPAARLAVTPEHLSVVLRTTEAAAQALAGEHDAAQRSVIEAFKLAQDLDNPFAEAFAGLHAARVAALDDDPERAHTWADAALELCRNHRFDYLADVIVPLHAWAIGRLSDEVDAEIDRAGTAIEALKERHHHHLLPQWLLLLADLEERAGKTDTAAAHVTEAAQLAQTSGDLAYSGQLTDR